MAPQHPIENSLGEKCLSCPSKCMCIGLADSRVALSAAHMGGDMGGEGCFSVSIIQMNLGNEGM